jgi:hypothetical protein
MITYNIISAGDSRLNMALRAMKHMHIDFGVLTETKLWHDKYTRYCEGYTFHSTHSGKYQGGVAIFYRNSPQWTIEGIREFDLILFVVSWFQAITIGHALVYTLHHQKQMVRL